MKAFLAFAALFAAAAADFQCPGSKSFVHAKCQVTAHLAQNCSTVGAEIKARATGANGWVDPHNAGIYALTSFDGAKVAGSHKTGAAPHYEDLFTLVLTAEGAGCKVDACSESQVTSVLDASTNYCNVRNLYCGSNENCPVVANDLTVTSEDKGKCKQSTASKCFIPARN